MGAALPMGTRRRVLVATYLAEQAEAIELRRRK